MNKSYKYTILTLFLALAFAFGSMAGMNFIMREKERRLLTERGRAVVEAPVRSWQGQDGDIEGGNGDYTQEEYVLTAEQMKDVISGWDEHRAVIHPPVNGQISMEDAMKAGEEWLMEMGMIETVEAETCSMYARLSSVVQNESAEAQLEPYYSFWFVRCSNQSMMVFLYINAVTGKVWNADIILYEDFPEEIPYEKLSLFAELSGLQMSDADIVFKNQEGTQAVLMAEDSSLCAEMEFHHSQTGYAYTGYGEDGLTEYGGGMFDRENVTIIFKLAVNRYK